MNTSPSLALAADWLCTFALHSTCALAAAWLFAAALGRRAIAAQEILLRAAPWAALVSATLQVFVVGAPGVADLVLPHRPALDALGFAPLGTLGDVRVPEVTAAPAVDVPLSLPEMSWAAVIVGVAAACALSGIAWLASVHRRLRRVLALRTPETDARVLRIAAEIAARSGLRQSPHLSRNGALATPIAFGFVRPEICLPTRATELTDASLRAMLAHEIAHLRRGDPAWTWLAAMLQALFPWQPLLLAVQRRWIHVVELRCDAIAAEQSSTTDVARCLLDVAEWLRPDSRQPALALGMAARPSSLRARVESALQPQRAPALLRLGAAGWSAASLVGLTFAGPGVRSAAVSDLEVAAEVDEAPASDADATEASVRLQLLRQAATLLQAEQRDLAREAEQLRGELAGRRRSPAVEELFALIQQRVTDLERKSAHLKARLGRSSHDPR